MKIRELSEAKVETFWGYRMWQKEQSEDKVAEAKPSNITEAERDDPMSGAVDDSELSEELKADKQFLLDLFFAPITEDDQKVQDQYDEFDEDYSVKFDEDFDDYELLLSDEEIETGGKQFKMFRAKGNNKRMKDIIQNKKHKLAS